MRARCGQTVVKTQYVCNLTIKTDNAPNQLANPTKPFITHASLPLNRTLRLGCCLTNRLLNVSTCLLHPCHLLVQQLATILTQIRMCGSGYSPRRLDCLDALARPPQSRPFIIHQTTSVQLHCPTVRSQLLKCTGDNDGLI